MPRMRSDSPLIQRLTAEGRIQHGAHGQRAAGVGKPNKYHAKAVADCPHCGFRHPSRVEAARCAVWAHLKRRGEIQGYDVHPTFTLAPKFKYHADFLVWRLRCEGGGVHVEDVKGMRRMTTDFRRVLALMERHPAGPLRVVYGKPTKHGYEWEVETRTP